MVHGCHCHVLASLSPRWFILRVFLHRIHAAQFVIDVQLVVVKTKIHARLLWDTSLRTNRNRSMAGWSTMRPGMIIAMPKMSRRSRSGGVQVVSSSQCSKTLTRTGGHFQGESLTTTCLRLLPDAAQICLDSALVYRIRRSGLSRAKRYSTLNSTSAVDKLARLVLGRLEWVHEPRVPVLPSAQDSSDAVFVEQRHEVHIIDEVVCCLETIFVKFLDTCVAN